MKDASKDGNIHGLIGIQVSSKRHAARVLTFSHSLNLGNESKLQSVFGSFQTHKGSEHAINVFYKRNSWGHVIIQRHIIF